MDRDKNFGGRRMSLTMKLISPLITGLVLSIGISVSCIANPVTDESTTKANAMEGKMEKIESYDAINNVPQVRPSEEKAKVIRKFVHSRSKEFDPNITAAEFLADMDLTVKPCDNFAEFVCRNYMAGKSFSLGRRQYFGMSMGDFARILMEANSPDEIRPIKNVRNFFRACLTAKKPSKENVMHTVKNILSELGGWPMLEGSKWRDDKFNWADLIVKLGAIDSNFFFKSGCTETGRCWILPTKSIFEHENLTDSSDETFSSNVNVYFKHLQEIIAKMGGNADAIKTEFFTEILRFDKVMFEMSQRHGRAYATKDTVSMDDLISKNPEMPFLEHLTAATHFISEQIVFRKNPVVDTIPGFIPELIALMNQTPKRTLANYALLQLVSNKIPSSHSEIINGEPNNDNVNGFVRINECDQFVARTLPLARDALYVRKFLSRDARSKVVDLITNIKAQTKIHLKKIDSLDNATIHKMLEAIDKIEVALAYPDEFFDDAQIEKYYDGLVIPEDDFIHGYLEFCLYKLRSYKQSQNLDLYWNWLKRKIPWTFLSYFGWPRDVRVPPNFLHGSFFNSNQPNYLNYAGAGQYIGTILGISSSSGINEISTLVNQENKKLDCQRYQAAKVLFNIEELNFKHEYESPKVMYFRQLGIQIAYSAYRNWIGANNETESPLPEMNYTPEQMFWINVMHQECSQYSPNIWKDYVPIVVYMMNSNEFRNAFGCPNVLENPVCPKFPAVDNSFNSFMVDAYMNMASYLGMNWQ